MPSKATHRAESANRARVRKLEAENAELRRQLHHAVERQPWWRLAPTFPALANLIRALGELAFLSEPMTAKEIDGVPAGRGRYEAADNGHSTKKGIATYQTRPKVISFDWSLIAASPPGRDADSQRRCRSPG